MKKTIIILLLAVLVACTPLNKDIGKVIRSGTQGLRMEFLQNPAEIYEGSTFSTLVELENRGAEDIRRGAYMLRTDDYLVDLSSSPTGTFQLKGNLHSIGGLTRIQFKGLTKFLSSKTERTATNLGFDACYEYQTLADANVCVDTDIVNNNPNKVCKPSTTGMAGGQGAPVAVTSVTTKMMPGEAEDTIIPQFVISVANTDGGILTAPASALSTCTGRVIEREDLNKVAVQAQLGGETLDCGEGIANIVDKTIVCTLDSGIPKSAGTYLSQLGITLDYGYQQTITQSFSIVKR